MSKPTASIYVPESQQEEFSYGVEQKMFQTDRSMSSLVVKTMINGRVLDTKALMEFAAKEQRTSRDRYLVVIID